MLSKNVLMSEEFEGPHGHYTLEAFYISSIFKIHFKLRKVKVCFNFYKEDMTDEDRAAEVLI